MTRWLPTGNFLPVIALSLVLSGCFKDNITKSYTVMKPIFASKASVLADIGSDQPRELESPGKIFIFGRYLFINEVNKGVHIIDNIDPRNPRNISFIKIPGNLDIAVKGTIMYADMYKDLLAIDISNPARATLVKDIPDVFPERYYGPSFDDSMYIIVDWEKKDTIVSVDDAPAIFSERGYMAVDSYAASTKGNYVSGKAGSMARFSIVNNYLYTVNMSNLHTFDISTPQDPVRRSEVTVGWSIETLYPFQNRLFVGSSTGMFIYELADPAHPQPAGSFSHARACDPVVADGDYAFVTLRTGTGCAGNSNQLDIVDVSDIYSPRLVKSYDMVNPAGLAKDGNTLFICDGANGLRVYDAGDIHNLELVHHISDIETYDVIAWNKQLILVTVQGIYQYDYSNLPDIQPLSLIPAYRK